MVCWLPQTPKELNCNSAVGFRPPLSPFQKENGSAETQPASGPVSQPLAFPIGPINFEQHNTRQVSVKTRLGFDKLEDMYEWVPRIAATRPDLLTFHGRTKKAIYREVVRSLALSWDLLMSGGDVCV